MATAQQLKALFITAWRGAGDWLMKHVGYLFLGCFALLVVVLLALGKTGHDTSEEAQQQHALTKKEVKQKEKVIAQKDDSIRTQTVIIEKIVHVRDSLKGVAKVHDARADSLIKTIAHETPTDPDVTPERVQELLSDYKPKAWALPAGRDSLR
jgi:hypothetical protein